MEHLYDLPGMPAFFADALRAVAHPRVIDAEHWRHCAVVTAAVFCIIAVLHRAVAARLRKTYFALHVMVNAIVTYLVWAGSLRALADPHVSTVPTLPDNAGSQFFMCWCFALHVYHPIFFRTGAMDWIHHTPVYLCNALMFGCLSGDAFHLQALIMTGIPGGVDCEL